MSNSDNSKMIRCAVSCVIGCTSFIFITGVCMYSVCNEEENDCKMIGKIAFYIMSISGCTLALQCLFFILVGFIKWLFGTRITRD